MTVMATATTTPTPFTVIFPWDFGTSSETKRMLNTDGDGASDPSGEGTIFEWNATEHGADDADPRVLETRGGRRQSIRERHQRTATCESPPPTTPMTTAMPTIGPSSTTAPTPRHLHDACPTNGASATSLAVYARLPRCRRGQLHRHGVFDVDHDTGLRINSSATPSRTSEQSKDRDGDGFGDNPVGANESVPWGPRRAERHRWRGLWVIVSTMTTATA